MSSVKGPNHLPMKQELNMIKMAIKARWDVSQEVRERTIQLLTDNINDESLDMKYRLQSSDLLAKVAGQQASLDIAIENLNLKLEQHEVLKQFSDSTSAFNAIDLVEEDFVSDKPQESLEG
jgi:hypothetical protein